METPRSHLRQIHSYSRFFGFLVLCASGTLGEETSVEPSPMSAISLPSPKVGSVSDTSPKATFPSTEFPPKNLTMDRNISSETDSVPTLLVTTPRDKEATTVRTLSLEQHSTPKHSEPDPTTKEKALGLVTQTKQANTTAGTHTSPNPETATTTAAALDKIETTKAVEKPHMTVRESASSNTTAATVGSTGLKPRGRKGEKEMSTTPGQHVQNDSTTHDTSSRGPETQYTTGTTTSKALEDDTGVKEGPAKGSGGGAGTPTINPPYSSPQTTVTPAPAKDSKAVTVAIVLSVLLLMILLLAILFCWRRRRSGSTSFKTAGWAGQAALPDDSGLEKELDQGVLVTEGGETRRATLTTFFGKRQSRVPSVAMEEVTQKETGNTEEAQRLIDGDANRASSPEGSGEVNGKLPEPTVQCSQEKEFPPPLTNQEETPPTKPE